MSTTKLLHTINFIRQHPLNKGNQVRAVFRFLSWQIRCRWRKGFHVMAFAEKSKLLGKKGLTGATGNIYCGLHEFEDMTFLLHFLREDDLFVDIGANIGSYSILAGSEVGAKVISFEPVPVTFSILEQNMALNNLGHNSQLYNNGVGNAKGVLRFTDSLDTVNHVIEDNGGQSGIAVDIVRLDETVVIDKPCLIKIDVEGFETQVLKGMELTLKNDHIKAIIIELNGLGSRYGYDESLIYEQLKDLNYKLYTYEPFSKTLEQVSSTNADNKIFIKDLSFVRERIASARPIKINGISF